MVLCSRRMIPDDAASQSRRGDLCPLPPELGITRVRHIRVAEVGYIRLLLGEGMTVAQRILMGEGVASKRLLSEQPPHQAVELCRLRPPHETAGAAPLG